MCLDYLLQWKVAPQYWQPGYEGYYAMSNLSNFSSKAAPYSGIPHSQVALIPRLRHYGAVFHGRDIFTERLKMNLTPFLHEFHPFFLTPFLNESHPFFRWNSPLFKYEFHPFSTWISPLFITTFMIEYHPLYEINYFIKDTSRRCIGTISISF